MAASDKTISVETPSDEKPKVLLVDDEDQFRVALSKQLAVRGFHVDDVRSGEDAIKAVRHNHPQVVVLDQRMPGMDGVQTLREIKKIRPEVQVIMLTGHGSTESARMTGKLDVFSYLEKPCAIDELVTNVRDAVQEHVYALARHEIPVIKRTSIKQWLFGAHNARPGLIILGAILFAAIVALPGPAGLLTLLSKTKTGELGEKIAGYPDYRQMHQGETISEFYSSHAKLGTKTVGPDGTTVASPLTPQAAAFRARVMIGTLVVAALFWATGAMPIGITALLVGAIMIVFGVLPPNLVAKAYAKDSVVFVFGVLAISATVSKTGLERRIAILLLGNSTSLARFAFLFAPLLAVTASFFSEHALVAFLAPVLLMVYVGAIRTEGLKSDRALLVMLMLMLTFCANLGGPGSPAAGGRNAVMLGILSDYGAAPTFGQWVVMGLPFVPVACLTVAAYFFFTFRRKIRVPRVNVAAEVKREAEKIGKMTAAEYKAAAALAVVVVLWVFFSHRLGMGGPALIGLVLMNVMGVARWKDINGIHWNVVALYAAASAMGYGLATSGAALWLADSAVSVLPEFLKNGTGLCVSSSLITGILTNFMSDGATVAAVGPITVPMATLSGTSPVMVGLATAFASSFAHMLIIGTPNNAICYAIAKDPDTGEQLLKMKDFLVHGSVVLVLSFAVLWIWVFFGYWQWL